MKCEATGKVIFSSEQEARNCVLELKYQFRKLQGIKRLKHRRGKLVQKRVYFCDDCNGFHLTHWDKPSRKKKVPYHIYKLLVKTKRD